MISYPNRKPIGNKQFVRTRFQMLGGLAGNST